MTYSVYKYWDTYKDKRVKYNIPTLEEALESCQRYRKASNYETDYYVFDSNNKKRN
jgi:hypothetical protein